MPKRKCTRPCQKKKSGQRQERESLEDEQQIFHRKKRNNKSQASRADLCKVRNEWLLLKIAWKRLPWVFRKEMEKEERKKERKEKQKKRKSKAMRED